MEAAKVAIENLTVEYPLGQTSVRALSAVHLALPPGEFCAVVGPSGCGKSTLLRVVAGLQPATHGAVTIQQQNPDTPLQAMVFQGRSVFPWMTVLDNAAYGLRQRGVPQAEREEIAERWLRLVGLGDFLRAWPRQLSEGMRQRVAIVRAFAVDPEVLLMDEPFGALDEQTRLVLQDELLRVWQATNKTVLFVTHSIDEAMILADRIIVLSSRPGRVIADIAVPFPRPRSVEAVRSDPAFGALFLRIWGLLRTETNDLVVAG
ncbi:MAG: mannosyltransferase [Chloroflexi bacterium]|nr:MAG: mannosyltransferase [Chloroflexota bacterium]